MRVGKVFKKPKNKPYFDPVDTKVNFSELEEKMLNYWYQQGVVSEYLNKNNNSTKRFSFLDGPITANNPMGVHHAWGRTYKDLWQRYYNMRGFKQRFQNGFDCQGLWVEVEVEKELGLKNKREIENLVSGDKVKSIAKFVDLCKERVYKYAAIQTEQSKRLGYFMDWDNSYFTLSDDNNYMIWHFLKKCHELGLIYKGTDVVPWCPRCETAISEHEILTEDYKEVVHDSVYLRFPIKGSDMEFLLVWTTTPWTIPVNISVAVDPSLDYQLVEEEGKRYWVAKKISKKIFGENPKIIKEVKGISLVGVVYEGPFDDLPVFSEVKNQKGFHEVIPTDPRIMPISEEEGTGLVHTSTSTGAQDHKLGKKLGLPLVFAIEDDGRYLSNYGFLAGKNAKENPKIILEFLESFENSKYLFRKEKYSHRYPSCWRCKRELVFKLTDEWYIAIDPVREKMKKVAKKIKWIPKFGLKRELDWLTNMHDWLISKKNRYWGLALPIWECKKCGSFEVIGSKDELRQKAVDGWDKFDGKSPHRPWIDEVVILCPKCGQKIKRILDVGNPWLDAGIVPFSTISSDNKSKPLYWLDKKEWSKWFPADFITESFPGQFKNWFYSLIAMSTVLEEREPFKVVLGFATLLAEDKRPMHKSWGNAIEFNEGAEKIGVDVMRWMYARQNPVDNLLFGYKIADEVRRRFHLKIWNVYNFFVTYANIDNFSPSGKVEFKLDNENVLDKWILSRLKQLKENVTQSLDNYNAFGASSFIEEFVEDLSNWYIRRSRDRTGSTFKSVSDRNSFYQTTYFVLINLSKILAPFVPFISDVIYRNLTKEKSVHLSIWPELDYEIDLNLVSDMKLVRSIVEKAHSQRKEKGIPVRQPLKKMVVKNSQPLSESFVQLIKDEINVKEVEFRKGKGDLEVKLDTKITPELKEEAKTRELIREIQKKRKDLGIGLTQYVDVTNPWIPQSKELIHKLKKATLTRTLSKGEFAINLVRK